MSNTRMMRLDERCEEFNTKLRKLNQWKGRIEKFLAEALEGIDLKRHVGTGIGQNLPYNLSITLEIYGKGGKPTFSVQRNGTTLSREGQLDLVAVQIVYEHTDAMIELAEKLCDRNGRLPAFRAQIARFN